MTVMRVPLLFIGLLISLASAGQPLTRIAFGSCSKQNLPDQMWNEILHQDPQLLILLGDNIYGDSENMSVMKAKYDTQKSRPDYQKLIQKVPVIGTWDDHDFGVNDGGRLYPRREESKALMLDFLDVPADDPVRDHPGVYSSHTYGSGHQKIKVILLDTRWFRDTLVESTIKGRRYEPGPGDVLGEAQWKWLEDELTHSDAALHLIGSSIQLIAEDHGFEKWGNFPAARQRFLNLLERTHPRNVIILSGDRHMAETSRLDLPGLPYPLYDFTSSGLTHTWKGHWDEPNSHRVGDMIIQKNFGMLLIDWRPDQAEVTFQIRGKPDAMFEEFKVKYDLR